METKIIEINLGVGMNQLFPEPVRIIIDQDEEINKDLNKKENGKKSKRTPKKSG